MLEVFNKEPMPIPSIISLKTFVVSQSILIHEFYCRSDNMYIYIL